MKNESELIPTASQTVGPFFHLGCTNHRSVECLADQNTPGERITVACRVLDGDGARVNDAMIEIWQANSGGRYQGEKSEQEKLRGGLFRGFGRLATDENGRCAFKTIKPGAVPANSEPGDGSLQAPHINVSVFARGILKRLCTRIYFAGDPANERDGILSLVPENRRNTLLATPDSTNPGRWQFTIHLCGECETVFFDV